MWNASAFPCMSSLSSACFSARNLSYPLLSAPLSFPPSLSLLFPSPPSPSLCFILSQCSHSVLNLWQSVCLSISISLSVCLILSKCSHSLLSLWCTGKAFLALPPSFISFSHSPSPLSPAVSAVVELYANHKALWLVHPCRSWPIQFS